MLPNPGNARRGKLTTAAGVGAILAGLAAQAFNVHSFASQAPPQWQSDTSGTAMLGAISGLLIVSGFVVAIFGIIRLAQSPSNGAAIFPPTSTQRMEITPEGHVGATNKTTPTPTPAFCSSCGARIVGDGHYCASCGASTAH